MDQQKLRTLVFDKTGVRIDIDDPIFALVALNEAVLAEAVERHVALLDDATADLEEQVLSLQAHGSVCRYAGAGGAPAAPAPSSPPASPATPAAAARATPAARELVLAAGTAVLCAVLVLSGQALFFRSAQAPAPPPVTVARELTPEQTAQLRDADKLRRIVQKLDAKTRNAIEADMAKP